MENFEIIHGNCKNVLKSINENSIDSIVCDPPYALVSIGKSFGGDDAAPAKGGVYARASAGFMGKKWDTGETAFDPEFWREVLRVMKPGAHLVAFGGTRTYHRLAVAIEDAGFEIRDQIGWLYGSGFPKSHDVSKGIDKAAGAEREVVGSKIGLPGYHLNPHDGGEALGHGLSSSTYETRLKSSQITAPATDAAREWQGWGTALKPAWEPIVLARKPLIGTVAANVLAHGTGAINVDGCRVGTETLQAQVRGVTRMGTFEGAEGNTTPERIGRWPANVIHDGSEQPVDILGDAARFFYCAKASKADRGEGNLHPTVKPTDLMRYLCRLVTPPGGVVLDPFMGSGSTGKAAMLEGFRFIGIEMDAQYVEIARKRVLSAQESRGML
jgi:DNA modification methylase